MHLHIIAKKTAIEMGMRFYFTGIECLHGHMAPRYVKTAACLECHAARLSAWRAKNRDHVNAYNATYQEENREYFRTWHSRNYEKSIAPKRRRQRMKMNGALKIEDPVWQRINKTRFKHLRQLAKQYEEWTGVKFEVDHIVPILDEKVCGLHWYGNWQLIPMRLNRLKRGIITHEAA